jgi:hypothetical protein
MDAQRLQFAQQKKSENMIDIGVGQRYTGNGRVAHTLSRMQFLCGFDLGAQVGGSSEQEPQNAVFGDGNLRLGAGLALEGAGAHGATIGAGAIPLGKRASGCGTKNLYLHLS